MWPAGVFGKYSGSILGTYGVYGKRLESIRLVLGAFVMSRLHWAECHSECFPNTKVVRFSKLSEFPAECVYQRIISVWFPNVFSMVSEWFPNTPNGFRIDRILPEYGPFTPRTSTFIFGKHSSCSKSIRGVRHAYGTQHLQMFIPCSKN
jgi:hypothetical protein